MKILYLTQNYVPLSDGGLYPDLINALKEKGHEVTMVAGDCSVKKTSFQNIDGIDTLRVKIGRQFGVNFIKKGLVLIAIPGKFNRAIRKHLKGPYDLILYATPPITLEKTIAFAKRRYKAKTYLMLKDIFPQNAFDLDIMKENGFIASYFKKREKKLYKISDKIGCMSPKNMNFLAERDYSLLEKVELFPNTIAPCGNPDIPANDFIKEIDLPEDKTIFLYGGNLGKPQGVELLLGAISELKDYDKAYFVVAGKGMELNKVKGALNNAPNATFLDFMSKENFDNLTAQCDVGLVLLDYRFTIPNFPSRILSYLNYSKPVIAATDIHTDIKELVEEDAKCGKWVHSKFMPDFIEAIKDMCENQDRKTLGANGRKYLLEHFDVSVSVEKLESFMKAESRPDGNCENETLAEVGNV